MKTVILIGPPGAGKGTQANLLADKYSFYHLETSRVLEEIFNSSEGDYLEVEGKKYYFKEEKKLWEEGFLCDAPFATFLVKKKIEKIFEKGESLVLAGSPRTLYEVEIITPLLEKLYGKDNIKIILITLDADKSIFRNSHRRICGLMRHPIIYNDETVNLTKCPLDGSLLMKRKNLDSPEVIKVRLEEYKKMTLPLLKYFDENGLKVNKVSGLESPDVVFNQIIKVVND